MGTTSSTLATARPPTPLGPPLHRILCPIDFSAASPATIAEAVALARACGGEITILFVIPYAPPSRTEARRVPEGVTSAVAEDVEALVEPARAAGITVRVCLKAGQPAHEILETIRRSVPDVVVIGTHGRGGFRRWALGSVADEVLRSAPCPVLTVASRRPGSRAAVHPPRRDCVVCAVALSGSSSRTIAYAGAIARATGARLTLVHVVTSEATLDTRDASAKLHAAASAAAACGLDAAHMEEVVVAGDPAREILRVAAARGAGLVVLGGERGGAGTVPGSIPDQVIRGGRCGVLTVRQAPPAAA